MRRGNLSVTRCGNLSVTRRNVLGGLAAILAARQAPALCLNLRGAMMVSRGGAAPTARDYVHMPTMAFYDGIENAGWNTHDGTTATWKDLINGYDAVDSYQNQFGTWSADGFVFPESRTDGWPDGSWFYNASLPMTGKGDWTCECVCNADAALMSGVARAIFGNMGDSSTRRGVTGFQKRDASTLWYGTYDGGDLISISKNVLTFGSPQSIVLVSNEAEGKYYVYANSILYASATGTHHKSTINGFHIGGAFGWVNGNVLPRENGDNRRFVGTIHALRVSDYAMSAADIAENYTIDKKRFGLL